ncbi:hypothetical protein [Ornithinimicrobium kibberense]
MPHSPRPWTGARRVRPCLGVRRLHARSARSRATGERRASPRATS